MKTYQRVCATINLNHIEQNLEAMYALTGAGSRFLAVLKTDAYGHGAVPLARLLEKKDFVHGYAVATVEEACELRTGGMQKPILILGYTFPDCYALLAEQHIMPTVFREDSIEALSEAARSTGQRIKVHVKVDTGMGRIGIRPDESGVAFVKKLLAAEGLELDGVFTHFARADEADKAAAYKQLAIFKEFTERLIRETGVTPNHIHCANSAAIMELKESYSTLVRAGVSMYGMWPSEEMRRDSIVLKPALSLHSHIAYIKEIEPATAVSYGGTFVAEQKMRVATIPVGYGDGYPRSLSGKGYVLIRGQQAPILGRICMDQFMVDISQISAAAEGDMVTLIGTDGTLAITMEALGAVSGRFNYELACDLNKRVPRVYTYQNEIIDVKDFYAQV